MSGPKWEQKVDPNDKRWVIVTMRIPNGGMPTATYSGQAAIDRLVRFCRSYLGGYEAGGALDTDELAKLRGLLPGSINAPRGVVVRGWMFVAVATPIADSARHDICFSARLEPYRSTTEHDWDMLGRCAAEIGVPQELLDAAIELTPPDKNLFVSWRGEIRSP